MPKRKNIYHHRGHEGHRESKEEVMNQIYYDFFEKMTLLEIVTLRDNPETWPENNRYINKAQLKIAYKDNLEEKKHFAEIDWDEEPYSKFRILKEKPPGKFHVKDNKLSFNKEAITVDDWESFIDSFRQVRNNLFHGAKLFKESGQLELEDRDDELINASLEFISFLEEKELIEKL